jgi:hypothetical protein
MRLETVQLIETIPTVNADGDFEEYPMAQIYFSNAAEDSGLPA